MLLCLAHENTSVHKMSLRAEAVSGIKWTTISQVGQQVMQFATSIILARLLLPSDFGLMAMAFVVISFVSLFRDLGTSAAIIQHKEPPEILLSTLFWINSLIGLIGMVTLFLTAPLVANFYREPRASSLLEALSVTFFVSGLSALPRAILERNLAFERLAAVETSAALVGSLVGIASALIGAGVWSLALKATSDAIVSTGMLWIFSRYRPHLCFQWRELKAVGAYSLNLTGFTITNYFARNADSILIGRLLGAESLGFYTLAYRTMLYPLQNISHVIARVMFPVYSRMHRENISLRESYLTVAGVIAFFSFPLMLGLMGLSRPFISTVFGQKWEPVVLLVIILAPVGMFQSVATTVGSIYQSKGRTDWMFRWGLGAAFVTVIATLVGINGGIIGVALAYAFAMVLLAYPCFAIPFRLINLKVRQLVTSLFRPLMCALFMLGILGMLRMALPHNLSPASVLVISVPVGGTCYLVISWLINRPIMEEILGMMGMNGAPILEKKVNAGKPLANEGSN